MLRLFAQAIRSISISSQTIDMSQMVTTAVDQLVNTYSGLFLTTVQPYLFPFLIVGLVIAGMFWMFDYPQRALQYFWRTILAYAVTAWLLRYYAAPMPVVGIPFSQIFRFEGRFLSAKIDISLLNIFLQNVAGLFQNGQHPNPWNIFQTIAYYLVLVSMVLPELVLFVETSFAIIALGIGALLGPLFVVLYVVPFFWTKQLFWSWVHSMIKFGLYRVFAAALVFIWATAEMNFLQTLFGGNYSLPGFTAALLGLLVFNGGCAILCLRLPRLVADFTGGTAYAAGGYVVPVAMAAARWL